MASNNALGESSHATEVRSGDRFEFGKNWTRFLQTLNDDRINAAEASLRRMLGIDSLAGKTFVDVGSGSGLFSLAARRLGARVHSFDFDPHSVSCTRELRRRHFPDDTSWNVEEASVLDADYISKLGKFDFVYSWGVLHHTGRMWLALDNAHRLVAPAGVLFIAIYNDQGSRSRRWVIAKRVYNWLPGMLKTPWALVAIAPTEFKAVVSAALSGRFGEYIRMWTRVDPNRGMNHWHDVIDWVGGYPYEYAAPDEIFNFYRDRGFALTIMNCKGVGFGCQSTSSGSYRSAPLVALILASRLPLMPSRAPVRVGFCIDSFNVGGTELNAVRTAEAVDPGRVELTVFHFHLDGPLRSRYEALGLRMVHLPIRNLYSPTTVKLGFRFAHLIRHLRLDVIHTHDLYTNIFAAPLARLLTNCRIITSRRWLYEAPRPGLNRLNRWSYAFSHKVLANSAEVARVLAEDESVPRRKIIEIPNFLSETAFAMDDDKRRMAQRLAWGVPEGAFLVGIVARLAPVKNHDLLLQAVSTMDDQVHVAVVGGGPRRGELELLAAHLGISSRVHFVGELVSSRNTHQYFDASILCSVSEDFQIPSSKRWPLGGRP